MASPHLPKSLPLARDIMAARLVTVRPETDVAAAIRTLLKCNISGMPVIDAEGKYRGVFSEKCCLRVLSRAAQALCDHDGRSMSARQLMETRLFELAPASDVFDAIGHLLQHRVSGAPVIDDDRKLLGVFSEKDSMRALIKGAYEQLPTAEVRAFMNPDLGRIISDETDLLEVARMFVETPYRRLTVVQDDRLVGMISRRDVLRNSRLLKSIIDGMVASEDPSLEAPGDRAAPCEPKDAEGYAERIAETRNELASTSVLRFVDTDAKTISGEMDLLSIAEIFLHSPYRRLPVLEGDRVIGQVSRRDLLASVYRIIEPIETPTGSSLLYLSALREPSESPSFG